MYARRDGEEMPLDMNKIIENRNKFYQEVNAQSKSTQNKNLEYHNKAREEPPILLEEGTVYNKVQGVRNKGRERYLPVTVVQDNGRTFEDHYGREIHKDNIRRTWIHYKILAFTISDVDSPNDSDMPDHYDYIITNYTAIRPHEKPWTTNDTIW